MSELSPAGTTFSVSARLSITTERAVLFTAEQPSQAPAVVNQQAGDFERRELHRAVIFSTKLKIRLGPHLGAATFGQEPNSLLPFGFPFQSPSASQKKIDGQCRSHVGLQRHVRPSGSRT